MPAANLRQTTSPATGLSRLFQGAFDLRTDAVSSTLRHLLGAVRLHLGMDVAFVAEFTGGARVFRYVDQDGAHQLLKEGDGEPLEDSYCQRVIDGRLPELIHNAMENQEARKLEVTASLGIGAHMSVPIRLADGSVFGTFCCFSLSENKTLNSRDLALMYVLAEIAAGLIEKDVARSRDEEARKRRVEAVLNNDALSMVWQPVVEIATGRIVGVEALARFNTEPVRSPDLWFKDAAVVGLGADLEQRAIEKGLAVLERLSADTYIACNVSAAAFLNNDLAKVFTSQPLHRLVLEITEHDIIEDYHSLGSALAPLRERGLRVAVDDAGAGYASFRHILKLQPDIVKLDMSLVRDIDTDIGRRSLAASLVQFSRELGNSLVAEGVETRAELDTLAQLGVHNVQGYFLHKPKPAVELDALFGQHGGAKH